MKAVAILVVRWVSPSRAGAASHLKLVKVAVWQPHDQKTAKQSALFMEAFSVLKGFGFGLHVGRLVLGTGFHELYTVGPPRATNDVGFSTVLVGRVCLEFFLFS
ncbi:unnamed protein product [Ectocarpus sp. 4 AP-2014]